MRDLGDLLLRQFMHDSTARINNAVLLIVVVLQLFVCVIFDPRRHRTPINHYLLPDTNGYTPSVSHHMTSGVYGSANGQWPAVNGTNSYAQTNGHYPPLGVCSSYAQTPPLVPALPNGISSTCPTTALNGSGMLQLNVR